MKIKIPYGHGYKEIRLDDARVAAVLDAAPPEHNGGVSETDIVISAMNHPIGSLTLSSIAEGKNNILIITSDHTRPVPSKLTLPLLLSEIRKCNSEASVKILIATGCHRATTREELLDKFGTTIVNAEEIIIHEASDKSEMTFLGILPSGGELYVNKLVKWADLIISEGFIEPHFFAGFSGGRKCILPGISYEKTVMYNHNAGFIAHPKARTGILDGNPVHADMVYAAEASGLAFILNVVLDPQKRILNAFAGDPIEAHKEGCRYVSKLFARESVMSDIVVTSNGGYPLDQNLYQAVKGMATAESCLNPGGVIIIFASCVDGHGGDTFYEWLKDSGSPGQVLDRIMAIPSKDTLPDQWQAQILARILIKASAVIVISDNIDPRIIENMHMLHTDSFEKAMAMANAITGTDSGITVIPDGVGIIIKQ